jgi:hypothetical protein
MATSLRLFKALKPKPENVYFWLTVFVISNKF